MDKLQNQKVQAMTLYSPRRQEETQETVLFSSWSSCVLFLHLIVKSIVAAMKRLRRGQDSSTSCQLLQQRANYQKQGLGEAKAALQPCAANTLCRRLAFCKTGPPRPDPNKSCITKPPHCQVGSFSSGFGATTASSETAMRWAKHQGEKEAWLHKHSNSLAASNYIVFRMEFSTTATGVS